MGSDISCGATCLKYLLFIFNLVFFICGATLMGVGIWLLVDPTASDYIDLINDTSGNPAFKIAVYLLVGVGAFIFLVGFLGCCGALRESSCMLGLYAMFMILLFAAQIAAAILAIMYKEDVEATLEGELSKQVNEFYVKDVTDTTTKAIDRLQFERQCCGGYNFTDYVNSKFYNETGYSVPQTCCVQATDSFDDRKAANYTQCLQEAEAGVATSQLYSDGCYDSLVDWMREHSGLLIGLGFGLAVVEIFGIVFACCVQSEIKKGY